MSIPCPVFLKGGLMDLLTGKLNKIYFKFLIASFGSALISAIYSIVDMAVVGQYYGEIGTASLAIVAPIWNIIYSLGLFMGVGGSVLFSQIKGRSSNSKEANQYFTISLIGASLLAVISTLAIILFEDQILYFFGATNDELLLLAKEYLKPILFVLPLFLFNQFLASYLRNDNAPQLATLAVLAGGVFNVIGDICFVFAFNMGIFGAGLATAIGSVITFVILLIHFFSKKNTLKIVRFDHFFLKLHFISRSGFSTFFVDAAMGILTILFNNQIMKYLGSDALAVYGPIINISTLVQCSAYSVGQASQPIISINYGANKTDRIKKVLIYSLITAFVFGLFWTLLSEIYPNLYIYIFIKPSENILNIAPKIIRLYSISFLLLPFNIFSTYYFQSICKPVVAIIISFLRGLFLSGALILLLPIINPDIIWLAMPISELLTSIFVCISIFICQKKLNSSVANAFNS